MSVQGAALRHTRYRDMTARHKEWVLGYAMLVPAFFFIIGLVAYPAAWAVYLSFTDKVIGQPEKFIGFQNYVWLTQWPDFGHMIWNTVLLAVVGVKLRFPSNTPLVTWMIPLLVLAIPLADTTLVSLSRIRRGLSPLTPGKDHISHRAVLLGWTHREAVLALWVVACALGSIALFVTHADVVEAYTVGIVTVVLAVYAVLRLERAWFAQVSRDKPDTPVTQPDQGS